MYFIGIDVAGEKKGQAVATLDETLTVVSLTAGQPVEGLAEKVTKAYGKDLIVAIDSPRQPSAGLNEKWGRSCEREVRRELGVNPQWTPDAGFFQGNDERRMRYAWMENGFKLFRDFSSCISPKCIIEVFPSTAYENFPSEEVKINLSLFNHKAKTDQLDAICCALTAWCFWKGQYRVFGDKDEGEIIVPRGSMD